MAGIIKRLSRADGVSVSAPSPLIPTSTQVDFTVNNNQSSALTISGLSFSSSSEISGSFFVDVERYDDSNYYREFFKCIAYYDSDAASWVLRSPSEGDESGITLSITAAGVLQYTTDNMTGGNYAGSASIANIVKVLT